jgi:hypothetical protein
MAYSFGGGVNPQLGAVDYSGFRQGAGVAAQGIMQGGAGMAQGIQQVGMQMAGAIQKYQEKQEQKKQEEAAVGLVKSKITSNPELQRFLGLSDPKDEKAIKAAVKAVGVPGIFQISQQIDEQEKQSRAIQEAYSARAATPQWRGGQGMLKAPAGVSEFTGGVDSQIAAMAAGGVNPNAIAGIVNARANAMPQGGKAVDMEMRQAELDYKRAQADAIRNPKRDTMAELRDLQIKQVQGELKASEEKKLADATKYARGAESQAVKMAGIRQEISEAMELAGGLTTTGIVGVGTKSIPGTPAYDLASKLQTILANIGFDRLQQMREASPTGGALGQVAVQELEALQNSIASLKQGQSQPALLENLRKVYEQYSRVEEAMRNDAKAFGGAAAPAQQGPSIQSLLDKYR